MAKPCIRFGVRSANGMCSDIWKCWTSVGVGKRDVYLTSRPLGKSALKLSLHEGGQWHIGFDASQRERLFQDGAEPASRFLSKWEGPEAGSGGYLLASRVFFPWSCPYATRSDAPSDTVWIPSAPKEQMVEVAVFLMSQRGQEGGWPGKSAMGTKLVGRIALEGPGEVVVVHRDVPMLQDSEPRSGSMRYFRDRSEGDLLAADRMVAWGQADDGSIMFMESKLEVIRKPD